jgi:hypothetical protein
MKDATMREEALSSSRKTVGRLTTMEGPCEGGVALVQRLEEVAEACAQLSSSRRRRRRVADDTGAGKSQAS